MALATDITGQRFERLQAIGMLDRLGWKAARAEWCCICDCGELKIVTGKRLRSGHTKSCGCLNREQMSKIGSAPKKRGAKSSLWRGGRSVNPNGYVRVWTPEGRRTEHRVIMERHLGRRLDTHEHVHHINGDRLDNRLENLQVISIVEHGRIHGRIGGLWRKPGPLKEEK